MPPVEDDQKTVAKEFFNFDDDKPNLEKQQQQQKLQEEEAEKQRLLEEETLKQQQSKNDDDEPNFSREKKEEKKGPSKEESNAILRKQRDEATAAKEAFSKIFGDSNPEVVKPLWDHLQETVEGGVVTPDTVTQWLETQKSLKEENDRLASELAAKDATIEKLDIKSSPVFEKTYVQPYKQAHDDLMVEFATIGSDKKIIGEVSTKAFMDFLTNPENATLDGIGMKAALRQYGEQFKKETGEDPTATSVTDMMKAFRNFQSKRKEMHDAYSNWGAKKKEDEARLIAEQEANEELNQKRSKRLRSDLASKAFREFPFDDFKDVVPDKEIESMFKEEFEKGEQILAGKSTITYDGVMQQYVKARLLDKMLPRMKELLALEAKLKANERSGLPGSIKPEIKDGQKGPDWLGE